ncbi:hypothetical protein BJX99DRAFT_235621 [Aspergillus californicus]
MPSLHAFSTASHFCCLIANAHRFRYIHFHVRFHDKLRSDIQHWERILEARGAFSSVRRLSFNGENPDNVEEVGNDDYYRTFKGHFEERDEWTDTRGTWGAVTAIDYHTTGSWEPLSLFLAKLVGLRELFWDVFAQFPKCMLDVLHQDIPRCRLDLVQFTIGDLGRDLNGSRDSYEYALATSPSLASIAYRFYWIQLHAVYAEHVTMQMAAGFAPNLTQLYLSHDCLSHPEDVVVKDSVGPLQPWQPQHYFQSKVRSLSLHDPGPEYLANLNKVVPFRQLTTLRLSMFTRFKIMATVAEYQFNSLECLVLDLRHHSQPRTPDIVAALLLSRLPPLRSLLLKGVTYQESTKAALKHHGRSLRRLGIITTLHIHNTWETIAGIHQSCANLRDLTLRIPRSMGDAHEVKLYQELSKISSLNHLTLELDCGASNTRLAGSYESDRKHVLINLAVDEGLVRAIFAILTRSSSSLLQSFDVRVRGDCASHGVEYFERLMENTTWQVFLASDGVFVHSHFKNKHQDPRAHYIKQEAKYGMVQTPCCQHWCELWPPSNTSWVYDWHSFPLQLDDCA